MENIKIFIAGDYCPSDRIQEKINSNDFSFLPSLSLIDSSIDYSILNLECPLFDVKLQPIKKSGPNLRSNSKALLPIIKAGFNCVTLANNHFRDFGDEGCSSTLNLLQKEGLDHVGGGHNIVEAQQILYKEIKGERLAIINICEHEFSIADEIHAGSAPLNLIDNFYQIEEAKKKADKVIIIVHGGHEMYQFPSPRMKKIYHFFIDLGVDAVINHHQHCYSGFEFYHGKPIVYGLGNFCFDDKNSRNSIWNNGYGIVLSLNNTTSQIKLIPYIQCNEKAEVRLLSTKEKISFDQSIQRLNTVINDDALLEDEFKNWIQSVSKSKLLLFSSYHNRYLNAALSRKLLPCLLSRKEASALLNNIECEAHRDITLSVLKNYINK